MNFRNLRLVGVLSVFSLGFAVNRAEAASYLYGASPYSVFVQNYFSFGGPDSVGAVAAGGNITLGASASVASGYSLGTFPNPALVAGGALSCPNQCEVNGNIYAGSESGTIYDNTTGFKNAIGGPDPIDFSDTFTQLKGLSTWLTGLGTTSGDGCTFAFTTLTCTAAASGLNVIDIPATGTVNAALLGTANLAFDISPGATLVIDVAGVSGSLGSPGHGFSVTDKQKLLFNYSSATTLITLGGTVDGSLLAPWANVSTGSGLSGGGQFTGNLIAQSYSGSGLEFENDLFNGDVPEPGTFAMLGGGVTMLLAALLMRRRLVAKLIDSRATHGRSPKS